MVPEHHSPETEIAWLVANSGTLVPQKSVLHPIIPMGGWLYQLYIMLHPYLVLKNQDEETIPSCHERLRKKYGVTGSF